MGAVAFASWSICLISTLTVSGVPRPFGAS
jgi:hypothetical protein